MTSLRLAVVGAEGRMGRRVVELASEHGFSAVLPFGRGSLSTLASGRVDVIVDFSSPEAFAEVAGVVAQTGTSLVSGTTGLGTAEQNALERASKTAAVLWEPNMSVGIHILVGLVEKAASQLGPDFDVEVFEAHHRMKADAPSGTAKRLVEALLQQRGGDDANVIFSREGRPGPRPRREIAVHALRGGDVVGDHTVHFLGAGERIELTHRATHRDVFAHGALRAARFLVGKPAGRYVMRDLVADAP